MALIRDNDIFYLVLNKADNVINYSLIDKLHQCLTEVEQSTGPAVMVTLGTNDLMFSSGFDPVEWKTGVKARYDLTLKYQQLLARFITLPVATTCIITGHCLNAGYFLALCHDFRLMKETKATIGI